MAGVTVVLAVSAVMLVAAGFALAVLVQRRRWRKTEMMRGLVLNHYRAIGQVHRLMDAFVAARAEVRQGRGL